LSRSTLQFPAQSIKTSEENKDSNGIPGGEAKSVSIEDGKLYSYEHTPEALNAMPFNGIGMPMLMDGLKIINANWIASKYPIHI
jgi:hypothetical protein